MVTVAIPVRNGGWLLEQTLGAVFAQALPNRRALEVLVCDSGSTDGSAQLARSLGAEVFEIPAGEFSHGATRNLLMERAQGSHVAFLTQDAVPAGREWLAELLGAFDLGDDIALVSGPYVPRADASPMVARELTQWFNEFSTDGAPRVDRLTCEERARPAGSLLGRAGFFTDANGCVARAAWESVPFRRVSYAEDRALALDMLRAGYAKAFVPSAPVIHSHEYPLLGWLQRSFDEARALREVYGFTEPAAASRIALNVWGNVGADLRWASPRGIAPTVALLARSTLHHTARTVGRALGSRAPSLPPRVASMLSLERRAH